MPLKSLMVPYATPIDSATYIAYYDFVTCIAYCIRIHSLDGIKIIRFLKGKLMKSYIDRRGINYT